MTIRWITPLLGTASADEVRDISDVQVIDVRDLVDKAGNRADAVKKKIITGVQCLEKRKAVIVCCDYGISRSNAIASGILAIFNKISLDSAVRMVQETTGETEIKLDTLDAVRSAIESEIVCNKSAGRRRTVLVTGARGFLGYATCSRLKNHFTVIAPSRNQLDIEQGSTQLSLLVGENNVDCIIHFANPSVYTSNSALGKTLTMLRNVLDVCVSRNVQLIYPSGWEIYSGYSGALLADEALPAFPRGPYGETKYLAEVLIDLWIRTTGLRSAILRSSAVYGVGSSKPKFIYNFIEKARCSEPIVTHHYLNGDPALDLLHVDDFVDAIMRICKQQYVGAVNIGSGIVTSTRNIAEILKTLIGSKSRIEQTQIDANTASIAMNYKRASEILGWKPNVLLTDGLKSILSDSVQERR